MCIYDMAELRVFAAFPFALSLCVLLSISCTFDNFIQIKRKLVDENTTNMLNKHTLNAHTKWQQTYTWIRTVIRADLWKLKVVNYVNNIYFIATHVICLLYFKRFVGLFAERASQSVQFRNSKAAHFYLTAHRRKFQIYSVVVHFLLVFV